MMMHCTSLAAVFAFFVLGSADEACLADDDVACLMQGGWRKVEVGEHRLRGKVCFSADLEQDTDAVPANTESEVSSGKALIKVADDAVDVIISWDVPGINTSNPVIGLHIHDGDKMENGAILVGFCGGGPLPPFSGACKQGVKVENYEVSGQACTITGAGSPCANPDGSGTVQEAAEIIKASAGDSSKHFYLNLHTQFDFNIHGPLGLIRGQLKESDC
eukprot:TRINITY_DN49727_c0_g1_i1.p1 TRINITY_DN49727_c0_g1~~TRINITY_DN49727_c0_g1_i1.p1  ORF type:complete len:239 (+),score=38.56 TRINITY_DN49727_c0_g1_i1:64-717(+)